MTQKPVKCPQCDAPLAISSGQKHSRCAYCDSKFVVDWVDAETPQLTGFETVLQAGVDPATFQQASQRVAELAAAIAHADAEVQTRRQRLGRTHLAYEQAVQEARKAIEFPQGVTLLVGLLAAVVWFLVAFVLVDALWYVGLITGIVLTVVTWPLHRRWMGTQGHELIKLQDAQQTIGQADAALEDALVRRDDCKLEQELRQSQVAGFRDTTAAKA